MNDNNAHYSEQKTKCNEFILELIKIATLPCAIFAHVISGAVVLRFSKPRPQLSTARGPRD